VRILRLLGAFGLGYFLGTVPSADLAARVAGGRRVDLRASGSRNPGAMNVARVVGQSAGRAVTVADVAKGYAGCAAGRAIAGDTGAHVGGTAAVIGHCYPVWSGFRGGKGVATSFGQCLYTFPAAAPVDLLSLLWWRRKLPNSWGPAPTAALFVANCATVAVIASRFVAAHRHEHPDELELTP
jgi:glycerol-3-phosphate acyltransferase PlsY